MSVTAAGEALSWGQNKHGQCGLASSANEKDAIKRPTFIPGLLSYKCISAACGGGHTIVLTDTGRVLSWGTGSCGQLGHGSKENVAAPRVVEALAGKHVTGVACGFGHTVVVMDSGVCMSFGWNRDAQCGVGSNGDVLVPCKVKGLENATIQHAACGGAHTALVSHKGDVYTFGSGSWWVF